MVIGLSVAFSIPLPTSKSIESNVVVQGSILDTFEDRLLAATRGEPADTDGLDGEIKEAVERQLELFAKLTKFTADEETVKIANTAASSQELAEAIETLLRHELVNELPEEMELISIRETFRELDVRLNWDYTITAGARLENKRSVRIRLPTLHGCSGCKNLAENAIDKVAGLSEPFVDLRTNTLTFDSTIDVNVEEELNKLADDEGVVQLDGWKMVRP